MPESSRDALAPEVREQLAARPAGLGPAGVELWDSIASAWVLRPDEVRILGDAAYEADLVERLTAELVDSPLQVKGSQGQLVASPLVSEVRQHRMVLKTLLGALHLPEDDESAGVTPQQRSHLARQAARARWDGPRGA